jgi:hypothetical protein
MVLALFVSKSALEALLFSISAASSWGTNAKIQKRNSGNPLVAA